MRGPQGSSGRTITLIERNADGHLVANFDQAPVRFDMGAARGLVGPRGDAGVEPNFLTKLLIADNDRLLAEYADGSRFDLGSISKELNDAKGELTGKAAEDWDKPDASNTADNNDDEDLDLGKVIIDLGGGDDDGGSPPDGGDGGGSNPGDDGGPGDSQGSGSVSIKVEIDIILPSGGGNGGGIGSGGGSGGIGPGNTGGGYVVTASVFVIQNGKALIQLPDGSQVSLGDVVQSSDGTVTAITGNRGPRGLAGKSAYQSWLDAGHTGTEDDFVAWMQQGTGVSPQGGHFNPVLSAGSFFVPGQPGPAGQPLTVNFPAGGDNPKGYHVSLGGLDAITDLAALVAALNDAPLAYDDGSPQDRSTGGTFVAGQNGLRFQVRMLEDAGVDLSGNAQAVLDWLGVQSGNASVAAGSGAPYAVRSDAVEFRGRAVSETLSELVARPVGSGALTSAGLPHGAVVPGATAVIRAVGPVDFAALASGARGISLEIVGPERSAIIQQYPTTYADEASLLQAFATELRDVADPNGGMFGAPLDRTTFPLDVSFEDGPDATRVLVLTSSRTIILHFDGSQNWGNFGFGPPPMFSDTVEAVGTPGRIQDTLAAYVFDAAGHDLETRLAGIQGLPPIPAYASAGWRLGLVDDGTGKAVPGWVSP